MKTLNDMCQHDTLDDENILLLSVLLQDSRFSYLGLMRTKRCMVGLLKGIQMETFTKTEWQILLTLFQCYPHYSPYEALLRDTPGQQLRTLRNHLYRMKRKLHTFHLTIASVHETGYLLSIQKPSDPGNKLKT